MATVEQIEQILMEPTERGMRAVGRALVLLYSKTHGGQHKNPMGVSMAVFYLNHGYLTEKHIAFWRRPLQDGTPHILLHKQELMILAEFKERRKALNAPRPIPPDIKLLNQQRDLLETVQDVARAPEKDMLLAALLELRKFEQQHGLTPAMIAGILEQDQQVADVLASDDRKTIEQKAKDYKSQSNGA